MNYDFEIGIIGGGPAGSTAAFYLAGYGFNVCLFEKKIFPRETLCGEFLSAEVIYFLRELNLFDEFLSFKPNKINSFCFFNNSGKSIKSKFNFDAYGLRRSVFDNFLLCNAKRKGVTVFQPAEVKEILPGNEFHHLIIKDKNQKEKKIIARNLISAFGKQNPLDESLNRNFAKRKSKLNGIKFHLDKNELKNFEKGEIQIYASDSIYCGVNSVDNNKITFCFLEDRNYEQPPPRKQLVHLQKENKAFEKLFASNEENIFDEIPVYGTGNIFFGKRNPVEKGIYFIGDAAGVIAPLAGDGIGIAMESGKLIADLFLKKRNENLSNKHLEYLFTAEWNNLFFKRMQTAKFIQDFILKKFRRNTGFLTARFFPFLLPYLINSTRNTSGRKILS